VQELTKPTTRMAAPSPSSIGAFRADGSRKNLTPKIKDREIDDLEHLVEHRKERGLPTE
jgi:hypothetical protein